MELGKDKYKDQEEVYSKVLRAGNRSYFFDVKKTRNEDLYLIITESKKKFKDGGRYYFEKHKLFLYKEDFEDFVMDLQDALSFATENNVLLSETEPFKSKMTERENETTNFDNNSEYTDIDFEDLQE